MLTYLARCKRVAILWDWIHGVRVEHLEREYSTTPFAGAISHGDIRRFADATRYHLRSAYEIAQIVHPGEGPSEEEIAALLRQLETGVPAAALELLELPVVLARGEYLALHEAGINSPLHLWRFGNSQLAELLGARRAAELEHHRPKDKLAA